MRVACLQTLPIFGDAEANLNAIESALATHRPAGNADAPSEPDLVVLPELATTGYLFGGRDEVRTLAEPVPEGPSTARLAGLAARYGVALAAGIAEREGDRLYNSAILVTRDGLAGHYRKVHLFDREFEWFDPGDLGFGVFDLGDVRVGLMVCFDWFYPESMRSLALGGADVVAHPANLVLPWCQESMPVRCLENHVFAVTANRVGTETRAGGSLTFTGGSQITGLRGEVLGRASTTSADWIEADIVPQRARDRRMRTMTDVLSLRRPDQYVSERA